MRGTKKKNLKSKRASFSNLDDPKFAAIKKETEYLLKYRKIAQSYLDDNELIDLFKQHNYDDEQILKEINDKIKLGEEYQWKEIIKGKAITAKSSDQAKHKKRYYREDKSYSPEESKEQITNKNQRGVHKNSKDFYHYIAKKPKRPFQKCIEVPSEYQPENNSENVIQPKKEKEENNKNNENIKDNKNNEINEDDKNKENNENVKSKNIENNSNEKKNSIGDLAKNLDIKEDIVNSKISEKLVTKVVLNEDINDNKSKELKLKEDAFRSLKNARKNWKQKSQNDISNNNVNNNINLSSYVNDNNTSNNISHNLSNDISNNISNNNICNDISNNISYKISKDTSPYKQNEEIEDYNNTPPGPEISSYSELQKEKRKREKYLRDFFVNMKKHYCRKEQNNIKRTNSKDSDGSNNNRQIENININNKSNTLYTKKKYKNSLINNNSINNSRSNIKKLTFDKELKLDSKVNNLTISSCYDNPYREQYLKMINEKKKQNPDKEIELIIPPLQYNPNYMQLYPPYQYGYNPYMNMNMNPNMYMMKQYQMVGQQIVNPLGPQETPMKLNKPQIDNKIDNNQINNINFNDTNQGILQSINANMISPRVSMAPSPVQIMEISMGGNIDNAQLSISGSGSGSGFHNISNDRVWDQSSSPGRMINNST